MSTQMLLPAGTPPLLLDAPVKQPSPWPTGRLTDVATLYRLLEVNADDESVTDVSRILAGWLVLGPDPAEVARVAAVPTVDVMDVMGRTARLGIVDHAGRLRGTAPDADIWSVTLVWLWMVELALEDRIDLATATPAGTDSVDMDAPVKARIGQREPDRRPVAPPEVVTSDDWDVQWSQLQTLARTRGWGIPALARHLGLGYSTVAKLSNPASGYRPGPKVRQAARNLLNRHGHR